MIILDGSLEFDCSRLERDLAMLDLPTDFSLKIMRQIKSYWGRYFVFEERINAYIYGLDYETAFPHILHECIHHYQYTKQVGFKRMLGVMHDKVFKDLYECKLREWELHYKGGGECE